MTYGKILSIAFLLLGILFIILAIFYMAWWPCILGGMSLFASSMMDERKEKNLYTST